MDYNDASQWTADLGSGYSRIYPLGEGGMGTLTVRTKIVWTWMLLSSV
mgnify:FL=1